MTAQSVDAYPVPESVPLSMGVAGKRVVVTGAGRGLGAIIATAFARSGATVGLVGRTEEPLRKLALSFPGEHFVMAGDVRNQEFNERAVQVMVDHAGGLDVWISNAGISPTVARATALDLATWESVIATNLTGAFIGARAAARAMQAGGRIIFTSSVIGQRAMSGISAYAASKGAVDSLVRGLALEMGVQCITVNAVAPGWFDSPLSARYRSNAILAQNITNHTALQRWGQPEDLAGAYLFLASEAARFITGAVIPVDGGYLLV